jgi:inosose dehydratase
VHFKDFSPQVAQESKNKKWDYFESVKNGVFCELGKGDVDFVSVKNVLNKKNYQGWIVVEQDVLPGMGNPKQCAENNRNYLQSIGL